MGNRKRFIVNGLIMTSASLILRMLGVGFNAFVSGKLGADGMGLFTLIMSVYGFTVTVATSGIGLAATRLCSEAESLAEQKAAVRRCLLYAAVCGSAAAVGLFCGAELIALRLLGDARCTASLRLLALSMPFIAASSVLQGFFSAVRRTYKSAAVGVFEQLFKILVTTRALLYLVPDGIEYACIALVGGGMLSECASFAAALLLFLTDRGRRRFEGCERARERGSGRLTARLFAITLPVAAAAYIRSAFTTVEHILIPRGLKQNPATADTALAAYGMLCGMVMPVIMLPTAFLYSFTGLLIPEFAEANSIGDRARVERMTSTALRLTLAYSVGCGGLMCFFSSELGTLIYQSRDCGDFIRIMAPLIPVMYLDHAVDAMLKGLGEQLYCMKVNLLDSAMCAVMVFLLCSRIGIYGYVVTIYVSELVNASLSIARLYRMTRFESSMLWLIKPIAAAVLGGFAASLMPSAEGWGSFVCRAAAFGGIYLAGCFIGIEKRPESALRAQKAAQSSRLSKYAGKP